MNVGLAYGEVLRSSGDFGAIPFPTDVAAALTADLSSVSDDDILNLPASVLVHMHRTVAQGGFQVISPRQVTLNGMLEHIEPGKPLPLTVEVGSDASLTAKWPVLDTPVNDAKLVDAPMMKIGAPLVTRTPADVEALRTERSLEADPLVNAYIKAKALVDFQRRSDVSGDPDGLAAALEERWGAPEGAIRDDTGITTDVGVALQRYAMTCDHAFPRALAPVHERRAVSVATRQGTRAAFGAYRAADWSRLRVVAEAVFLAAVSNEHYSLRELSGGVTRLVGQPALVGVRKGVLVFQQAAATSWYFGPETFVVVAAALNRHVRPKNPIAVQLAKEMLSAGRRESAIILARELSVRTLWTATVTTNLPSLTSNAFINSLNRAVQGSAKSASLAKAPMSQLRTEVYQAVTAAPLPERVKFSRMLATVRAACEAMEWAVSPDAYVAMARRLTGFASHLSNAMAVAATHRRAEPEEWYRRVSAQAPSWIQEMGATSSGWACLATYFLATPSVQDDRWAATRLKMLHEAVGLSDHAVQTCVTLTQVLDRRATIDRIVDAMLAFHKSVWAASYDGVAAGAFVVARMCDDAGYDVLGDTFRAGATLWSLKSRLVKTITVRVSAATEESKGREVSYVIAEPGLDYNDRNDASYMYSVHGHIHGLAFYQAWKKGARAYAVLKSTLDKLPDDLRGTNAYDVFRAAPDPWVPALTSVGRSSSLKARRLRSLAALRYVCSPSRFAMKMRDHLVQCMMDITMAAQRALYEPHFAKKRPVGAPASVAVSREQGSFLKSIAGSTSGTASTGWAHLASAEDDFVDWATHIADTLSQAAGEDVLGRSYASLAALETFLDDAEQATARGRAATGNVFAQPAAPATWG